MLTVQSCCTCTSRAPAKPTASDSPIEDEDADWLLLLLAARRACGHSLEATPKRSHPKPWLAAARMITCGSMHTPARSASDWPPFRLLLLPVQLRGGVYTMHAEECTWRNDRDCDHRTGNVGCIVKFQHYAAVHSSVERMHQTTNKRNTDRRRRC